MNKRIKSLLDRAEYQAEKHPGPDWEVYVEPSREQILEKFAELIVKECVATMYKRGETYAHPRAGFFQAKTFAEAIMDYFGVIECLKLFLLFWSLLLLE
jgi:hypothetical protein